MPSAYTRIFPNPLTWPRGGDLVPGRQLLFANANDDVRISVVTSGDTSGLYCNSDGGESIYPQNGSLQLESVYGHSKCVLVPIRS